MTAILSLAPLLERFFTQRLIQQRRVSPHTISSYRDTFRQFLKFTQQRLHKSPSTLGFEEIDAPWLQRFSITSRSIRG
jgi:site-specific recombinase XerD